MRGFLERLALTVNLVLILLLCFVGFRRDGPARRAVDEWLAERRRSAVLATRWGSLSSGSNRLDTGTLKVAVVEFADYQCPFCKANQTAIENLLRDTSVGFAFRNFPIQGHVAARGAARTAVCAAEQGRFRAMHSRLFDSDLWQVDTNWVREAIAAGVPDTNAFRACLAAKSTDAQIDADIALGQQLGVDATPTFLTQRELHAGTATEQDLRRMAGRAR